MRELNEAQTRRPIQTSRKLSGTAIYPILAAAFYQSAATIVTVEMVVISHRIMGRVLGPSLPDFSGAVGNFAVHYPVSVEITLSFGETIQRVAQAL